MSQVLSDTYQSMAANAISYAASMVQTSLQESAYEYQRPSVVFKPRLSQDGNAWIAVFGDDMATGVVGIGESPDLAMRDFDRAWYKKTSETTGAKKQ